MAQSQRLKSPTICCLQAANQESLWLMQSESGGLRTKGINGVSSHHLKFEGLRTRSTDVHKKKMDAPALPREQFAFVPPFVLFTPLIDWVIFTCIGESRPS